MLNKIISGPLPPVKSQQLSYAEHAKHWEKSYLNQHDYCKANNLSYGLFVTARSKLLATLGKTRKPRPKAKFIQVQAASKAVSESANNPGQIVLRLAKGSVIELPANLSCEQLVSIFKSLGNAL